MADEPLASLDLGTLHAGRSAGTLSQLTAQGMDLGRRCELEVWTSIANSLAAIATLLAERTEGGQ